MWLGSRLCERPPPRASPAQANADRLGRNRSFSRSRRGRDHGRLQSRQQPAPPAARRERSRAARDAVVEPGAGAWAHHGPWLEPSDLAPHAGTRRSLRRRPGVDLRRRPAGEGSERQPAYGLFTSGTFFTTLRIQPQAGRFYGVSDDVQGGGRDGQVAVISDRFWERRFGRALAPSGHG